MILFKKDEPVEIGSADTPDEIVVPPAVENPVVDELTAAQLEVKESHAKAEAIIDRSDDEQDIQEAVVRWTEACAKLAEVEARKAAESAVSAPEPEPVAPEPEAEPEPS